MKRLVFLLLIVVAFMAGCGKERASPSRSHSTTVSASEKEKTSSVEQLYILINSERERSNLPPLLWSDELTELALAEAHDMCERGYLSHINPEGEDPVERARKGKAGRFVCRPVFPRFLLIAENIAEGFQSADDVFCAWMNSPPHRSNILDGRYIHIGIGTCGGALQGHEGCGRHWVVILGAFYPSGAEPPP